MMITYEGCSISKNVHQRVTIHFKCNFSLNATADQEKAELDQLDRLAKMLGGSMSRSDRFVPGYFEVKVHFDLTALAFPDTTEGLLYMDDMSVIEMHMVDALNHTAPKIRELWQKIVQEKQPIREECQSCGRRGTDSLLCHTCHDGSNKEEIAYYEPITKVVAKGLSESITHVFTDGLVEPDETECGSMTKTLCGVQEESQEPFCKGHMAELKQQSKLHLLDSTEEYVHGPITKDFQNEEYKQMAKLHGTRRAISKIDDDVAAHRILEYYQIFRKELPPEEAAQLLNVIVNNLL